MAEVRGHGVAMATTACLSPYRLAALERTMAQKSTASSSTQAATCRRGSTRRTSGEQTAGRCRTLASVRSVCRRHYDHLLRHLFPLVVLCCERQFFVYILFFFNFDAGSYVCAIFHNPLGSAPAWRRAYWCFLSVFSTGVCLCKHLQHHRNNVKHPCQVDDYI